MRKRFFCILLLLGAFLLSSCAADGDGAHARVITLAGDSASLDGVAVEEFTYTWHCDPSTVHDEEEDAPAEYHTGSQPQTDAAVYIDRDLHYFPQLAENDFLQVNYDGETEWAYYYQDGQHDDYIFATLPRLGEGLPVDMMHSEEEAAQNKVLHITAAGTYVLEGDWQGQIWVELGERDDAFNDAESKVCLILNGVDIHCTVAPGLVFYSVYECDNGWEERDEYTEAVNTDEAGAKLVIADGSSNSITGANVFRMLKPAYKDESAKDEVRVQKKLRKIDGALYSYVSLNICGEAENSGSLTVNSSYEGLDSELHLAVCGGNIQINSQDDGINVNEDLVSVVSFYGGQVIINAGLGAEGDGVDSNGFILLDGGSLEINGITAPDSALDSECGVYYRSGSVTIDGQQQNYQAGEVFRESGGGPGPTPDNMPVGGAGMPEQQMQPDNFDLQSFKEQVSALADDATLDDVLALLGMRGAPPTEGQQPSMPGEQPPAQPQ